jgi:hypothetical protein
VGGAYTFANYKEFNAVVFAGSYLEMTRIDGTGNRLHVTSGIELHPWIVNFGAGADLSAGYSNYLVGIGVDIVKAMVKLDLIPTPYTPPYKGFFPSPLHLKDEGLPRPMVKHWRRKGPDMNPIKVIEAVPGRAQKKYQEVKDMILKPKPPENPDEAEDKDAGN